jgi:hypothetical protein
MNIEGIPVLTITALHRYVNARIPTGDFLRAVLSNNLSESIGRADEDNLRALPTIVAYIYNELPSLCWGSEERVQRWLEHRELEVRGE